MPSSLFGDCRRVCVFPGCTPTHCKDTFGLHIHVINKYYTTKVLSPPCECPLCFQVTLAVCVLSIFMSWNPAPWGVGARGRGLWEVTRSWGWGLREWDLCPIKDTQKASSLLPPGEVTWKGQSFMRKQISPDVMSADAMVVDFAASKTVINKCVYCL